MVVMMTVPNLDSCLAVDVGALETMKALLHGDARRVRLQRAELGVRRHVGLRGGLSGSQYYLAAFSWYPSRCGLIYIKLPVHDCSTRLNRLDSVPILSRVDDFDIL
jgi:hypothetical protein